MKVVAGTDVWSTIEELATTADQKAAAVAFVSSDRVIQFGAGDVLVTDATDAAVAGGLTSARVLDRAFRRGASLYSLANLHAKVLVLGKAMVIGSANLSLRSRELLLEAITVSNAPKDVASASAAITSFIQIAQPLDRVRIDELLQIETKRPTSSASEPEGLGEPHIIFFREVLPGDVKKYGKESAEADSGGGARDLRVSVRFLPLLRQMLPEPTERAGVTHGPILSRVKTGQFVTTDIEFWRPANKRNREFRFSRIYCVPGWRVRQADYDACHAAGETLFFVLEMDEFGTVYAKILSDRQLSRNRPFIRAHLDTLIAKQRGNSAIAGAVDVVAQVGLV